MTDLVGNKQIVSKDQSPIAIKALVQGQFKKFGRFQESGFQLADKHHHKSSGKPL